MRARGMLVRSIITLLGIYLGLLLGSCSSVRPAEPPPAQVPYREALFTSPFEQLLQGKLLALRALEPDLAAVSYDAVKAAKGVLKSIEALDSPADKAIAVRHCLRFLSDEPSAMRCEIYLLEYIARRQTESAYLSAKADAEGLRRLVTKAQGVLLDPDSDKLYKAYLLELLSAVGPRVRPSRFDFDSPTFHADANQALRMYEVGLRE